MKVVSVMCLLITAGGALGLALRPDTRSTILGCLALGLVFRLLWSSRSCGTACLRSLVAGLAAACVSSLWVPTALITLGASKGEAFVGFGLAAIACAGPPSLTIGMGLGLLRHASPVARLISACAAPFVVEHLLMRSTDFVPWILWGHVAGENAGLVQLAAVGGVPLVSAAVSAGGWSIAELSCAPWKRGHWRLPCSILCGLVVTSTWGLAAAKRFDGPLPTASAPMRLLALQPGLTRAERLRPSLQALNLERLTRVSRQALANGPASRVTLVWPEGAILSETSAQTAFEQAGRVASILETALITGLSGGSGAVRQPDPVEPGTWNAAGAYDPSGRLLGAFHKHAGVPVIEARPISRLARLAAGLLGAAGAGPKLEESPELAPLRGTGGAVVALCYEILLPSVVEARRPTEASVILNLADDSWVESEIASRQLTTLARFRAIEQRLPLLRVAHGGLSASFDAFGEPLARLEPGRVGLLEIEVSATRRRRRLERARLLILPIGSSLLAWLLCPIRPGCGPTRLTNQAGDRQAQTPRPGRLARSPTAFARSPTPSASGSRPTGAARRPSQSTDCRD